MWQESHLYNPLHLSNGDIALHILALLGSHYYSAFDTKEPVQNFKTVAQSLLGETAHFGFCPPKIGLIEGVGGGPRIFFSHCNVHIFVS